MQGKKILIVEDEQVVAIDLRDTLLSFGYRVTGIASSGEQAIGMVDEETLDLVLMDIHLSGKITGIAAAEEILRRHTIPVMYLTAYADPGLVERAKRTRPYGYLIKPYDEREIRIAIEIALYKADLDRKLEQEYAILEQRVIDRTAEIARANAALQKSEALLNEMGRMAKAGGWEIDTETQELVWTKEVYRIHEVDMSYKPTVESGIAFYAPSSRPIIEKAVQRAIEAGEPFDLELEFITAKGNHRWVHAVGKAVLEQGRTRQVIGIIQDITERKEAEEVLKRNAEYLTKRQAEYQDLVQLNTVAMLILDEDYSIVYANTAAEKIFGRSSEELAGVPFGYPVTSGELAEIDVPQKGGTISVCEIRIPDLQWKGRPAHMVVIQDITERKKIEVALQESEKSFHGLFNTLGVAIYVMDVDGRFLEVNKGATDLFRQTRNSFVGQSIDLLYAPGTFDIGQTINRLEQVFSREPQHFEFEGYRSNREVFHAECWLYRGFYFGKDVIIGLVTDVTRRKDAEEELRKLYNELEARVIERTSELSQLQRAYQRVNEKLNILSSITRHDVNNQLTSLMGYLDLLSGHISDSRLADMLDKAQKAAKAIHIQIAFTRNYQDIGIKAPQWQHPDDMIREVITELPVGYIAIESHLDNLEVYADPLLNKVIYTLVENATRHGETITKIQFSSRETPDGMKIICEDDGVGVPYPDKENIFLKGFGKHTGLGLFLAREILSITGITITENGEPGKGARFEITVPDGAWRKSGVRA